MRDLIKNTLENEFDEARFSGFVKNLFNEITINPQSLIVTGGFGQHITSFNFLGEFNDAGKKRLDVLTVELSGNTKVARARSMQRNIIAKYLKDNLCDAALVAFYSRENPDWRLSFVKMEYMLTDKGAKVEIGTPPRRYSFLVGKTEPSHTAGGQLLPILEEQKVNPLVAEIEDAFGIEKVTKEFFVKYKQLFTSLEQQLRTNPTFRNEAVRNNIDATNFAKKLLGQIVFLYFLQKKGWLGVSKGETWGKGDKHFLRHLFDKCLEKGENFFNDYLEFLFYDTLNNPRNDQADRNYSARFNCKIPFLNGGLFEPEYDWQNSFIYLNNNIFADILDVFDLYNFTVKEDEPLEKEVAVDPEMLGKVFENLLEENLRKGKGIYYTPREIVHYMCQESLTNYIATESNLNPEDIRILIHHLADDDRSLPAGIIKQSEAIDKTLAGIKVVDPACGSGAFCVGMLQEIIKARLLLNPSLSEYKIKKETIQNCIYGVDIDPGAIEIAKLRLWLSLVVDYDLEDIEPLPNLDYKIMQGNSLLEELVLGKKTIRLFDPAIVGVKSPKYLNLFEEDNRLSLFDNDETTKAIFEKYHKWQLRLFNAKTKEKKKEARENLEKIQTELIEQTIKSEISHLDSVDRNIGKYVNTGIGLTKKDADKKAEILNTQANIHEILNEIKHSGNRPFFLWHLYFGDVFLEKGGFDVVIANPPYVRADSGPEYLAFRKKLEESKTYNTLYEKWDLMVPFIERGLNIANQKGDLIYIVSNAICTSKYAFKLLDLIQEEYFTRSIDYFEEMEVFEAGVVPVVLNVSQTAGNGKTRTIVHRGSFENRVNVTEIASKEFKSLGRDAFRKEYNPVALKAQVVDLGDICYISYGLRPNSDERFWKGEFTAKDIIAESKDKIHCKPYVEGKDLGNYKISRIRYLEWNTSRIPKKLVRPTFPELYNRPKIMRGRVTCGIYDETGLLCNDSIVVFVKFVDLNGINNKSIQTSIKKFNRIPRDQLERISEKFDLKYLLAILNSSFALRYLNNIRRHRLENYFYPNDFRKLPITDISSKEQKPLIDLVDKILAITKDDDYLKNNAKQANVREYEKQIDQLVYELYGLTEEEITIVEGKA